MYCSDYLINNQLIKRSKKTLGTDKGISMKLNEEHYFPTIWGNRKLFRINSKLSQVSTEYDKNPGHIVEQVKRGRPPRALFTLSNRRHFVHFGHTRRPFGWANTSETVVVQTVPHLHLFLNDFKSSFPDLRAYPLTEPTEKDLYVKMSWTSSLE